MKKVRVRKLLIWPHRNDHSVTLVEKMDGLPSIQITTFYWKNRPLDYRVTIMQDGNQFTVDVPHTRALDEYLSNATGFEIMLLIRQQS